MRLRHSILLFLAALVLTSCLSEFRPEIIDPRLPDYSEEGLNTAGAYIDGFPWMSRRQLSYFFIFPSGISGEGDIYIYRNADSTSNMLAFEFGEQTLDDSKRPVTIGFYLESSHIVSPPDLHSLNGKTIVLDGETNYGQLFLNPISRTAQAGPDTLHKGIGLLHIRNVQTLNADSVVVSGTFGFDVKIDSILHSVHSGRFDYALSKSEFHRFRP